MSWLRLLYETYDELAQTDAKEKLLPIAHTTQQAQIEVIINNNSEFVAAKVVSKADAETVIPCSEESAGRAGSAPVHHPLMDKLQYLAGDYTEFGGAKGGGFHEKYMESLQNWCQSEHSNKKAEILLKYLKKGHLIKDLVNAGVIHCDDKSNFMEKWPDKKDAPEIYKVTVGNQSDAFVRFRVNLDGDDNSALWQDKKLQQDYINYYFAIRKPNGVCSITGKYCFCTVNHPSKIRNTGDKAKLISANDGSGFTYKGRFLDFDEAALVSYEVSQKAHSALRYLIKKQGMVYGSRVFLLWSPKGYLLSGIAEDSLDALLAIDEKTEYTAENTAEEFNKILRGYGKGKIDSKETVAIIAVDAATTGRMAVTFYRELLYNEFVERVTEWHQGCAWRHRYKFDEEKRVVEFTGAPSPDDIALAAYGVERKFLEIDKKQQASIVEIIMHCILDGSALPRDIVESAYRNACQPQKYKNINNWRKVLSICCSMVKKYRYDRYNKEVWTVSLQKDCDDVAYLCGRMLAVADALESSVLKIKGEKRETAAMRYFTKFRERPNVTWQVINDRLRPYVDYLATSKPELNVFYSKKLAEISAMMTPEQFASARNLDGKMALGFYAQQDDIYNKKDVINEKTENQEV